MSRKEVVIVTYGRSACCRARKGSFANMHPIDYAAQTLKGVLSKVPSLKPEMIDDVIVGCAMPTDHLSMNAGRLIVNRAGLPDEVTAQTINRFCSSGLQSISNAANAIWAEQMDCVVAGGVESMTHCFNPYPEEHKNPWIVENYIGGYMGMGETAERVAEKYAISRKMMDQMAFESHSKAYDAQNTGKLSSSIIPVLNNDGKLIVSDEGIRPTTTIKSLSNLDPCFRPDGVVTAATSSQMTDAAAFVVLMSLDKATELGIKPIAKFLGFSVAGCDPTLMGMGPIYAIPKVLELTKLSIEDMDVIELNEAFASQSIACINELNLDSSSVNPYGGAMALGHPMGATGSILTIKALDWLEDNNKNHGLISMCIGGGMGAAGIVEKI